MKNWKIQTVKCVDRNEFIREVFDENGDCVAELTNRKNESLILAAPELLEALEAMLQFAPILDGPDAPIEYIKALDAIQKAKGEV